jgi:hypothetical protein
MTHRKSLPVNIQMCHKSRAIELFDESALYRIYKSHFGGRAIFYAGISKNSKKKGKSPPVF